MFNNLGLLLLASMSIPVFSSETKISLSVFITGIIAFLICVIESLLLIGGEIDE